LHVLFIIYRSHFLAERPKSTSYAISPLAGLSLAPLPTSKPQQSALQTIKETTTRERSRSVSGPADDISVSSISASSTKSPIKKRKSEANGRAELDDTSSVVSFDGLAKKKVKKVSGAGDDVSSVASSDSFAPVKKKKKPKENGVGGEVKKVKDIDDTSSVLSSSSVVKKKKVKKVLDIDDTKSVASSTEGSKKKKEAEKGKEGTDEASSSVSLSSSQASTETAAPKKEKKDKKKPDSMMTIESFMRREKKERTNEAKQESESTFGSPGNIGSSGSGSGKDEEAQKDEPLKSERSDTASIMSGNSEAKKKKKKKKVKKKTKKEKEKAEDDARPRWNPPVAGTKGAAPGGAFNVRTWELVDRIRALRGQSTPTGRIGMLSATTVKRLQRELWIASILPSPPPSPFPLAPP
jgi:hypothetical protein